MGSPVLTFADATLRLRDQLIFQGVCWQVKDNEQWAILGPNGSGKSTLVRSIWGGTPLRSGQIRFACDEQQVDPASRKDAIGYVSFELHQRLMEREAFQEDAREYSGRTDAITSAEAVIYGHLAEEHEAESPGSNGDRLRRVTEQLEIGHLLQRSITALSTGEMRKVLIARALVKSPRLLILDEPFDGLDAASQVSLATAINTLMTGAMRVILVTHRLEEVVSNITHVLLVKDGRLCQQGPKSRILTPENLTALYGCPVRVHGSNGCYSATLGDSAANQRIETAVAAETCEGHVADPLVEMKNVVVRYGNQVVLDGVDWMLRRGENWAILGPNGSGKSTLLRLIAGDHLQAYSNHVVLFGRQRGSGDASRQIKQRIGVISADLQVRYRKNMDVCDVIASGFYDSIGLYRRPTREQQRIVEQWLELLGINVFARKNYHHLSYGQKRQVLFARAMVKSPLLLILDEPCQGLDLVSRRKILDLIEIISKLKTTQVLYATHHPEEIPAGIGHVLQLDSGRVVRQT